MKYTSGPLTVASASESPAASSSLSDVESPAEKKSLRRRIRAVVWDSFERSHEERRFIAKIDFFILTWAGFTYFSKNLNTNNICQYKDAERQNHSRLTSLSQRICLRDERRAERRWE